MRYATVAAGVFGLAVAALASQALASGWLSKEFMDDWNTADQGVEHFLNVECRPSGLDGIQMIGIQKGHSEVLHLHIYCRPDGDRTVQYRVTRPTESKGKIDANVRSFLDKANVRIGPFWFGADENVDGFYLVEKTR